MITSPLRDPPVAQVHRDWTFELDGINGPRRPQLANMLQTWTLKDRRGGYDIGDQLLPSKKMEQSLEDLEVVLADRVRRTGLYPR
jgi:hypothetical protein